MNRTLLAFGIAALALPGAESYNVRFFQHSVVAGTELKPGEYSVEVNGNKAVISGGKKSVEAAVKVETSDSKFASTSVKYQNGDGKYRLTEIRFGGTKTKIIFEN